MRHAALLLLIAGACALPAAADPAPSGGEAHTDVRRELLSEFRFAPAPADPAPVPTFLSASATPRAAPSEAAGPDVVTLAPFTVREMVRMETLHADILQEKKAAQTSMVLSRLGIALHVAPVGPVAFYAATIFYIPFAAGFAISW
ncbi:MAG TPA: hypothetical protein VII43_01055 [Opitutaceae bacterium]